MVIKGKEKYRKELIDKYLYYKDKESNENLVAFKAFCRDNMRKLAAVYTRVFHEDIEKEL